METFDDLDLLVMETLFQSPCGEIGDGNLWRGCPVACSLLFQSPCGEIGDGNQQIQMVYLPQISCFNPLAGKLAMET